jgi:hypothetical protein
MRQMIYFMIQPSNEIVKLIVKGKGLTYLFDYYKEFAGNEHMFQYVSHLKAKQESGELGTYYSTEITKGEKLANIDDVAKNIRDISEKIKKMEEFYATKVYDAEPEPSIDGELPTINEEEIPTIEDVEEVNVKDIPF